jgi:hypothetical protein
MSGNYDGSLIGGLNLYPTLRFTSGFYEDLSGDSAYEVAVENGFVGTEKEWLRELSNAAASYSHRQVTASDSWVVDHNLEFYPNVSSFDDLGNEVKGQVVHNSKNQVELLFNTSRSGFARLS